MHLTLPNPFQIVRTCLVILLSVASNVIMAQTLSGKVTDSTTRLPLYGAHIACPETGEGTITDENGYFRLISRNPQKSRTIVASYVGYQTLRKSVSGFSTDLSFELHPDTTVLEGIVITAPDPVVLIRSAWSRVEVNHGGPRLLAVFYRMVSKNKDKYIKISEASLELNQFPPQYNQIRILKTRSAEDEKRFNGVGMGIGTPVSSVKNFDITLRREDSFLSDKNLKKYDFFYEGVAMRAGVEVHEISFDQKKVREALYRGRIFLHTASLAFVALEYGFSPKGIRYFHVGNAAERAALKLLDIQVDLKSHERIITFRQFGPRWYLDHVSLSENVDVRSKRYNFDVPLTDRAEFLVTRIDTTFRESFEEKSYARNDMVETVTDTTKSFWEDYNTIPSPIDYNAIALEIESRNGYSGIKSALKDKLGDFPKDEGIRIDSVLSYYHTKGLFNGTALVKRHGKVILHKGYGYADKELQIKNDTSTAFRIGSVAKTFTSYVIRQLKQEDLLSYNDSIQRFIPWYPHPGITIHHLLTHSSGIPNYMSQANFLDSIRYPFTIEKLVRNFGLEKPTFDPGTQFRYSNTGYTILALIAEKASGKSFAELFEHEIVKPLDLSSTSFARQDHALRAKGYLGTMKEPAYFLGNVAGAGAITSTTTDLLKWDNAHDDPALNELFIPRTWYHDWGAHYGYGWNIDKYQFRASKKHTIQYHGGTDFGFQSILARQPDKDNLVVLLNNTGEFPLFDIMDIVLDVIN
jgi:CubicO group peptidase (beta-lactamase class C family)